VRLSWLCLCDSCWRRFERCRRCRPLACTKNEKKYSEYDDKVPGPSICTKYLYKNTCWKLFAVIFLNKYTVLEQDDTSGCSLRLSCTTRFFLLRLAVKSEKWQQGNRSRQYTYCVYSTGTGSAQVRVPVQYVPVLETVGTCTAHVQVQVVLDSTVFWVLVIVYGMWYSAHSQYQYK
jgi:hypothetical protein